MPKQVIEWNDFFALLSYSAGRRVEAGTEGSVEPSSASSDSSLALAPALSFSDLPVDLQRHVLYKLDFLDKIRATAVRHGRGCRVA